ncbi:MAG TPA: biotin transporter BioY [Devosiaceae bacterium]|jgi:biotin transport system substrate-specific component|nr:biotin transporter BioY [Devosiaceae bacterium]
MAVTLTTQNTVLGVLLPQQDRARLLANLVTVVLGSLLLTLSAKVSVPVLPVPVTLATFAVAALAAGFGWRIGVATVALYIAQGLAGLPVFTFGGGWAYVMSPTFGFILGYLPMAYIIGRVADAGASGKPLRLFAAMLVADAVVFAVGFLWLLAVAGLVLQAGGTLPAWIDAGNLLGSAYEVAIQPFILWDILKLAFAALTVAGLWTLLRRKRS